MATPFTSIPCGSAIFHPSGSLGSLGCLVRQGGTDFILSNNHILARANRASNGDLTKAIDASNNSMVIATLTDFVPLNIGAGGNTVDAAISQVSVPGSVTPDIQGIGNFNPNPMSAFQGQRVIMRGAASRMVTRGQVTSVNHSIILSLSSGDNVQYVQQIQIDGDGGNRFSRGGDSGSLILDEASLRPVGLLVGADGNFSYANNISLVLNAFALRGFNLVIV